ncbi:MAG: DnaA/Hda family protein [Pseudomonadota bacterium]
MPPEQFTLRLDVPQSQTFDNFVCGRNDELVTFLQRPLPRANRRAPEFDGVWLYGAPSSGRSHLLRATLLHAHEQGVMATYVGCGDYPPGAAALGHALEHATRHGQVVALDDVDRLTGSHEQQLLFAIVQRLLLEGGRLLLCHQQPAQEVGFELQDLASRVRSLQHFALYPLDDEGKALLLRRRASARGYELGQAVLDYWLARGPRELARLLEDLERLDQASLARLRKITVPLLKDVLGY